VFFGLAIGISVIGIILSGIKYMTAKSDIKATVQAREALSHAIIGFLLAVGGYSIYRIILNTLGAPANI
jgi:hypothetical protein